MSQGGGQERRAVSRRDFMGLLVPGRDRPPPAGPGGPPAAHPPGRFSLAGLGSLPDPVLRSMVPVLRRDIEADIGEDGVRYRTGAGGTGRVGLAPGAGAAVRLFDGIRTLEQVGAVLDAREGTAPGRGFLLARGAFVALAAQNVYHPVEAPAAPAARVAPGAGPAACGAPVCDEGRGGGGAAAPPGDPAQRGLSPARLGAFVLAAVFAGLVAWLLLRGMGGCGWEGWR